MTYLERQGLASEVDAVVGRTHHDAALLKPNPHLLGAALRALGAHSEYALVVGDSTSDVAAARAIGTRSIGYANKPGKSARLIAAGADAVIETLTTPDQALGRFTPNPLPSQEPATRRRRVNDSPR